MKLPQGKTILITGATSGHGAYLAEKLSPGNTVLLHGRDRIRTETFAARLGATPYVADLGSIKKVRRLASEIRANHPKIDILINNAGIGYGSERELSPEGHELRFTVMYLAPMLLTSLLLPRISEQILNIGSLGQESLDFDDLMMEKNYSGLTAYRRAKLALVMATFDLALKHAGLKVNVVHPATYMDTNMVRRGGGTPLHTVAHGGTASLKVLASGMTGRFFNEDRPSDAHPDAYREDLRDRLKSATDAILGAR